VHLFGPYVFDFALNILHLTALLFSPPPFSSELEFPSGAMENKPYFLLLLADAVPTFSGHLLLRTRTVQTG
jgi:hypothetical protein